jgi:hypothetical protein
MANQDDLKSPQEREAWWNIRRNTREARTVEEARKANDMIMKEVADKNKKFVENGKRNSNDELRESTERGMYNRQKQSEPGYRKYF